MKSKITSRIEDFILSFKEIWKFDKRLLFILFADIIISALVPFPNIIFSGLIVNSLVDKIDFILTVFYIMLMFGISFLLKAINTYLKKSREYLFIKFTNKLNNDINNKCLNTDFEKFNDSSFQDHILLINQMSQGNNFFTNITSVFEIVSGFITLVGIILVMTMLNSWLFVIALVVIALQSVLHVIQLKYNKQYQFDTIHEQRKIGYVSRLAKAPEVKKDVDMFNMHDFIIRKIESFQKTMLSFNKGRIKVSGLIEMATYSLSMTFQLSAYILLGINVLNGVITIGEFTTGIASLLSFISASSSVSTQILDSNDGIFYIKKYESFHKLRSKFDSEYDVTIDDIDLNNIEIEFKNVSFRYPNSTSYVLKNINLVINIREKLAIVGYNGAGKTSFVLLLTRMYDPTEGAILLNGIDIRRIRYVDYLKLFSTVNQDFSLLAFSMLENIAQTENVTDEEKEKITKLFENNGMGERLKKMYKGLDTPITKTLYASGVDLSGGERQKVAIIRSLFNDAPVLVLDEPTAALDPVSEYEVYRKFSEMSEGQLAVYISHRIYSTRFCDKIAVFDNGEMKEYGTFDQLMDRKGLYYDFYQAQSEVVNNGVV